MSEPNDNEFERAAAEHGKKGLLSDFWGFMKENKKWWLLPLLVTLLALGLLIFLSSGTGLAPFIYTLF
jgi:predicted TIM-barrel fold metal-dependent hydrolase